MSRKAKLVAIVLGAVGVLFVILLGIFTPPPPPPPPKVEPEVSDKAREVGEAIVAQFGNVLDSAAGQASGAIIVFAEKHDSLIGQVEIAAMLNRLRKNHDLRHVGLEGALAS